MRDPSLTQDTHVDLLEIGCEHDREIQAAKLGLKPLQVDWANSMSVRPGTARPRRHA